MSKSTSDFWAHVQVSSPDECWPWTRLKNQKTGYGLLRVNGKMVYAHRRAYELTNGAIPIGMYICHACDNPICCNPHHLWAGPPADNVHDRDRKGRHGWNSNPQPSYHAAKITVDDVVAIRREYANGGKTYAPIAEKYGLSPSTIGDIITRKTWRHIPSETTTELPNGAGAVVTIEGPFLRRCVVLNGTVIHSASTIDRCRKWIKRCGYTLLETHDWKEVRE